MKRFLRILCFALVIVMLLSSFVACDNKKKSHNNNDDKLSKKDDSSEVSETSDETSKPVERFIIGTNAEFPPFEFVAGGEGVLGNFDGIDMAIAKQIAEDNGMKPIVENMEFDSLIIALKNGQVDAVIAAMTIDPERAKEVDFSIPYYNATEVMIVKEGSEIVSAADMADKKIAVIEGYFGEFCVQELQKENGGYEYESFKKHDDAIQNLINGKCDVVVLDSTTARKYVKQNKGLKSVEDVETFGNEQYGIAVKKGNTELLDKINKSLKKMIENGDIEEWAIQYSKPVISM